LLSGGRWPGIGGRRIGLVSENLGTREAFGVKCVVGDGEMLYAYGCQGSGAPTIVLRGANEYMLDEMDRALHDSLCMVKRMLESRTLVPGGGAVEVALSVYLENYAMTLETREQLADSRHSPKPCWSSPRLWLSMLPRTRPS
jgi:chaperonin GroEL (HSP60 family)